MSVIVVFFKTNDQPLTVLADHQKKRRQPRLHSAGPDWLQSPCHSWKLLSLLGPPAIPEIRWNSWIAAAIPGTRCHSWDPCHSVPLPFLISGRLILSFTLPFLDHLTRSGKTTYYFFHLRAGLNMQTHVFAFWAILLFVTDGCIYCTFLRFSEGAFFPCMLHFSSLHCSSFSWQNCLHFMPWKERL